LPVAGKIRTFAPPENKRQRAAKREERKVDNTKTKSDECSVFKATDRI
jgi:hypothetical protein